ncbi:MAG: hypothetical protein R3F56_11965 [Planctomycetota bacterium]
MSTFPLHQRHLEHIRRHLSLLVARIESTCNETTDPRDRRELEKTCTFAHDLLDKVCLAEQAVSGPYQSDELVRKLDERCHQGQERLDALHARLEAVARPERPDLEEGASRSDQTGDSDATRP